MKNRGRARNPVTYTVDSELDPRIVSSLVPPVYYKRRLTARGKLRGNRDLMGPLSDGPVGREQKIGFPAPSLLRACGRLSILGTANQDASRPRKGTIPPEFLASAEHQPLFCPS